MNASQSKPIACHLSAASKAIVLILCLLLSGVLYAAAPASQFSVTTQDSANRYSAAAKDSLAKAATDAMEVAATQRQDFINTVLEVIGSVLAIAIIVFFAWKMSSGWSKSSNSRPPARPSGTSGSDAHQEIMQRRMKMAKK